MSTKNNKSSFIEQSFATTENQNYNLNLNQSNKCPIFVPLQSYSKPKKEKYCGKEIAAAVQKNPATLDLLSDNYEKKQKLQLWNKSFKTSSFTTVNEDNDDLKNANILKTIDKSTIFLHIAAYENSTEADASDLFDDENIEGLKREKFWPVEKQCFTNTLKSRNPFEFARQQNGDQKNKPEVMQFKASQQLLGSNLLRNDKDDVDRFCGANVIRSESDVDLTSAITDFYKFGEKEIFEIIQTRGEKDLPNEIILHTHEKNFSVKVDCFVKHSLKIRELVNKNNLPRIVNLSNFNVGSVKIFVKYIHCGQLTAFRLISNRVLDLLQIARIFHVYGLIEDIAKYLVSTVGPKFDTVLMLNLLVITSDWSMALNQNLRSTIYTVASNNFIHLWKSATFPKIPFSILILLFNRCDLSVKDEFEIATLILQWLEFTNRSEMQCLALAQTIRAGLLTQKQKNEIIIRLSISTKAGKRFSKIFENVLNSSRSQRCCVIEDHIKVGYKRCGIPAWNEELRPIENIKIKVSQKIQEEKDITFIDKSRPPPCVHKDDDVLLSDEPSEYLMQFWADYWKDNNEASCNCTCHQIKKKKMEKEKISLLTPKKKGDKLNPSPEKLNVERKRRGSSSRRKSKKSVESTKSDSVLLSGKFPHFHAPKPDKESP